MQSKEDLPTKWLSQSIKKIIETIRFTIEKQRSTELVMQYNSNHNWRNSRIQLRNNGVQIWVVQKHSKNENNGFSIETLWSTE